MVLTNPDTATLGPIVWTSLALLLCSYAVSWLLRRSGKPLDLPQVDCRRMTGNKETLQECFEKVETIRRLVLETYAKDVASMRRKTRSSRSACPTMIL